MTVSSLSKTDRRLMHKNTIANREWQLKTKYGLSIDDVERMLKDQNSRCSICRCPIGPEWYDKFHVDHNHTTGKVRGLLCLTCNLGLGAFKDSVRRLAQAIVYLEEHGESFSTNYD